MVRGSWFVKYSKLCIHHTQIRKLAIRRLALRCLIGEDRPHSAKLIQPEAKVLIGGSDCAGMGTRLVGDLKLLVKFKPARPGFEAQLEVNLIHRVVLFIPCYGAGSAPPANKFYSP